MPGETAKPKPAPQRKQPHADPLDTWEHWKEEWATNDDGEGQPLPDWLIDEPEHFRHDHLPHIRPRQEKAANQKIWGKEISDSRFTDETVILEPWKRGQYGKGIITPDKEIYYWATSPIGGYMSDDGLPAHGSVRDLLGINWGENWLRFYIAPDGQIRGAGNQDAQAILEAVPGTKFEESWSIGEFTGAVAEQYDDLEPDLSQVPEGTKIIFTDAREIVGVPHDDYSWPALLSPSDTLYIGPLGAFHWDMLADEDFPELKKTYGPHPDTGDAPSDVAPEGWAEGRVYSDGFTWYRNHPGWGEDQNAWAFSSVKTADKLHDFLMNPKSRPDLQTEEGQKVLEHLKVIQTPKNDKLLPWVVREWKKGRLTYKDPNFVDRQRYLLHLPDGVRWPTSVGRAVITAYQLDHVADWLNSEFGQGIDIMQMSITDVVEKIEEWNEYLINRQAEDGRNAGEIVYQYSDGWTIRKLGSGDLDYEGAAMGHCVGGYCSIVESGSSEIYSLRDPNGEPHATIEATLEDAVSWGEIGLDPPMKVVQIQGKQNREPLPEYKEKLKEWFTTQHPDWLSPDQGQDWYGATIADMEDARLWLTENQKAQETKEPGRDEYGLINEGPGDDEWADTDYENLLGAGAEEGNRGPYYYAPHADRAAQEIVQLALARKEIPDLANALENYGSEMNDSFDEYTDMNQEYAEYPWHKLTEMEEEGQNNPEVWQEYGQTYQEALQNFENGYQEEQEEWASQHPITFVSQVYEYLKPYWNEQSGQYGEYVNPGIAAQNWESWQTVSKVNIVEGGDWEREPDAEEASWMYRRPFLYDRDDRTVYLGAAGMHHEDVRDEFSQLPFMGDQVIEGFIMANPQNIIGKPIGLMDPHSWDDIIDPELEQEIWDTVHPGYPLPQDDWDIRAASFIKEESKLEWLQKRDDKFLQSERGQSFMDTAEALVSLVPTIDPLLPWLARETKKQRLFPTLHDVRDDTELPAFVYTGGPRGSGQVTIGDLAQIAQYIRAMKAKGQGIDLMQHELPKLIPQVQLWKEEEQARMGADEVYQLQDGWTIEKLLTAEACTYVGEKELKNCIRTYGPQVELGDTNIFVLRDWDDKAQAAMEVDNDGRVVQAYDAWDNPLNPSHREMFKEFAESQGYSGDIGVRSLQQAGYRDHYDIEVYNYDAAHAWLSGGDWYEFDEFSEYHDAETFAENEDIEPPTLNINFDWEEILEDASSEQWHEMVTLLLRDYGLENPHINEISTIFPAQLQETLAPFRNEQGQVVSPKYNPEMRRWETDWEQRQQPLFEWEWAEERPVEVKPRRWMPPLPHTPEQWQDLREPLHGPPNREMQPIPPYEKYPNRHGLPDWGEWQPAYSKTANELPEVIESSYGHGYTEHRRPIIYYPDHNLVFVGPPGGFHYQLRDSEGYGPDTDDGYINLDLEGKPTSLNFFDGPDGPLSKNEELKRHIWQKLYPNLPYQDQETLWNLSKTAANDPKVVDVDFEFDEYWELQRRPIVYVPAENKVFVGPAGAFHEQLEDAARIQRSSYGGGIGKGFVRLNEYGAPIDLGFYHQPYEDDASLLESIWNQISDIPFLNIPASEEEWTLSKTADWADIHAEFKLPVPTAKKLRKWVDKLEWPKGAKKEPRDRYHVTIVSVDNPDDKPYRQLLGEWREAVSRCSFKAGDLDIFGDNMVVLKLSSDEWSELALSFAEKAEEAGLDPRRFQGGPRAHVTLGTASELPTIPEGEELELEFSTAKFNVNKNAAVSPEIVEIPVNYDDENVFEDRRPWAYDPSENKVYVGPWNAYHWELVKTLRGDKGHGDLVLGIINHPEGEASWGGTPGLVTIDSDIGRYDIGQRNPSFELVDAIAKWAGPEYHAPLEDEWSSTFASKHMASPSRPEGEWPEEWKWPEYPDRVYHAVPLKDLERVRQEGLKPMVSDAQRGIWPEAQPFIHAHDDVDELIDRFGDYLYQKGGPFTVLSLPAKSFKHWLGLPNEEMGAIDDGSGREQFTWFADQPIPPQDIEETGVVWPEEDKWVVSKNASRSQAWMQDYAVELAETFGPDQSIVVYQWPDGWSVRQLTTYGDMHREGKLMSNCWALDFDTEYMDENELMALDEDIREWHPRPLNRANLGQMIGGNASQALMSLRDPANIPHVSFIWAEGIQGGLGKHNSDPKPEYLERLSDPDLLRTLSGTFASQSSEHTFASNTLKRVMYHVAPARLDESILQSGLKGAEHPSPWGYHTDQWYPRGNYLYSDLDYAEEYAGQLSAQQQEPMNVYKVDVEGLEIQDDPENQDAYEAEMDQWAAGDPDDLPDYDQWKEDTVGPYPYRFYTPNDIEPGRLIRNHTVQPSEWEKSSSAFSPVIQLDGAPRDISPQDELKLFLEHGTNSAEPAQIHWPSLSSSLSTQERAMLWDKSSKDLTKKELEYVEEV